jgi:4-amino-4-deoxy-L-arabinose transferase-like glycosyltransferase
VLWWAPRTLPFADGLFYHVQALLLADGKGFVHPFRAVFAHELVPTAAHPPLFPLLLAAVSRAGGDTLLAHQLTGATLGTGTVLLIGVLARRCAGPRAGLAAAGIAAAAPQLWLNDALVMSESLFGLLAAAVVLAALGVGSRRRLVDALLLGAGCGLAVLVRGEALLWLAVLAVPLTIRRLGLLVVALATAAAIVMPWALRNVARFERPVVVSTNADEVIAAANCDITYHGRLLGYWSADCYREHGVLDVTGDESEVAVRLRTAGFRYVRDHAVRLSVVAMARLGRQWDLYRPVQNADLSTSDGRPRWAARVALGAHWVLVPAAVAGAVRMRRRGIPLWPMVAPAVSVSVTAMAGHAAERFRVPADVAMCALAGGLLAGPPVRPRPPGGPRGRAPTSARRRTRGHRRRGGRWRSVSP